MKPLLIAIASSVILTGCATPASSVMATPAPAGVYSNLNCEQLASAKADVDQKVKEHSATQDVKASADGVSVALSFIIPFYFVGAAITGGNTSNMSVLSNLKGQQIAIDSALTKTCR